MLRFSPAKGHSPKWTPHESDKLGGWFKENGKYSKDEIERRYYEYSGQWRSYRAIQTELYRQGLGYLTNKRGKSLPEATAVPEQPTCVPATQPTKTSPDYSQLSRALELISGSLALGTWRSSGPGRHGSEVELESSSPGASRRRRSGSQATTDNLELGPSNSHTPMNAAHPDGDTSQNDRECQSTKAPGVGDHNGSRILQEG